MKILYVKINSERAKEFQLKTIIYEENGERFVKKEAIYPEAIAHLKQMKTSYKQINDAIVNPHIKLAKIINESKNSLTFEFIEGISLEKKYTLAKKLGEKHTQKVIQTYMDIVKTGFATTNFDSSSMVTNDFKKVLGDFDYSEFDGQLCFDGISNIDLIFSNIIFKESDIYLIDYEWVYTLNIPIHFSAFRALHTPNDLHWKMEKHFVFNLVVSQHGFLNIQNNYAHPRLKGIEDLEKKDIQIENLNVIIDDKSNIIHDKEKHIYSLEKNHNSIIYNKDIHIENQDIHIENQDIHIENQDIHIENQEKDINYFHVLVESMRIKNRIKRTIPTPLWKLLKVIKSLFSKIEEIPTSTTVPIVHNYLYLEPTITEEITKELKRFTVQPLISIIMPIYNVSQKWLDLAIKSIEAQWYTNWELCMVDDKSTHQDTIDYLQTIKHPKIKISYLEKNLNISGASNAALLLSSGEYIALMDNDDELSPDALYEVVKAINRGAEFIYSDEDKIEMDGRFSDPHFKPDFAEDMFLSQNYLSHLGVIKKDLITKVNGFTLGLEGSQDFDLYLKVLEHTDKIYHISKVLYHWRKIPGSTATEYTEKAYAQEAGCKALENAMERRNIQASVKNGLTPGTYKVDYAIKGTPLLSIIIPFKDKPVLLKACIESILYKSTYQNFEIIGISNNSQESEIFTEMDRLKTLDTRISFYEYNIPFNYSQINNYAVTKYAKGEHILFLNNDIEIITATWIEELLMYSQQKENAAIGAKLYFPNDTIQHAGIVIAPKTIHSAILMYQGFSRESYGYISRLKCVNNYSAVTAACLMIKKTLFNHLGGFDSQNLSIAYNDVDLCLRAEEQGYKNIWTPYCEAYHHESISRGYEINVQDVERREKEKWHLKNKHSKLFSSEYDPYYNKKLTYFAVGSELATSETIHYQSVNGIPFYEEIISKSSIYNKKHTKICIFSHFDEDNEVKDDVIYYINALSKFMDIIFVSTSEHISKSSQESLKTYCKEIIVKKNIGYDFGAWKTGLNSLGLQVNDYEQLILCNDSVYGPLFNLEDIFKKMHTYDLWSMTDNYEIEYHLQSYFIVYNRKVFQSSIFLDFWKKFKIYHNKQALIENNEIGFSQQLINSDFSYSAYYSVIDKNYVNVLQYYWQELISQHQFPFIKKELLKRNPLNLKIDNWEEIVNSVSQYDTYLISNHLKIQSGNFTEA